MAQIQYTFWLAIPRAHRAIAPAEDTTARIRITAPSVPAARRLAKEALRQGGMAAGTLYGARAYEIKA